MNIMVEFSKRFRELLEINGLTLKALSYEINLNSVSLSEYQNCRHIPNLENAVKIADFFECTLDYLFGLSEEEFTCKKIMAYKTFSDRLKALLNEKGCTKSQLYRKAGIPKSNVNLWLRTATTPSFDNLILLAKIFDESLDYIAGRI